MSEKEDLSNWLKRLEDLNAELSYCARRELLALAERQGSGAFDDAAAEVARIIGIYLGSPVKKVGQDIMAEYFRELERGERLLAEAGEIARPSADVQRHSVTSALVRYSSDTLTCLDRCKVLNRTSIPQPLTRAADAFRRRQEVVDTVMELGFEVLWLIDSEKCQKWFLAYLEEHDGSLDPDVLRDMLKVALHRGGVLPEFLHWAEKWSADESLCEYWPHLVSYSDRLLCRHALQGWQAVCRPRNPLQARLSLLVRQNEVNDDRLIEWERQALEGMGECVQRFMDLSGDSEMTRFARDVRGRKVAPQNELSEEWRRAALFSELKQMAGLLKPVLLAADQLLRLPDGPSNLAMAVLGLSGNGLARWEEHILKVCERAILRGFLVDLKEGRSPMDSIRRLTFGDEQAFNYICGELDLLTQQFDSLQQRDKVVKYLGCFYASFRRADLLGAEVSRRYRNMRRLLHEDYWQGHLDEMQMKELEASGILRDLDSLAACARKYLDRRRSLSATLEEMVAGEMEFVQYVRHSRLLAVKEFLTKDSGVKEQGTVQK